MTESTTISPPNRDAARTTRLAIEEDASPLVRLVGRTLRSAVEHAESNLVEGIVGTVAVRSHDTPQVATVSFADGFVGVTSGLFVAPDATLTVDLHARFAPTGEPTGDARLATAVLRALRAPLPHWREAAARFWEAARDIPGIPDVLVVDATGADGSEQARFGTGTTSYGISGPADLLAGVFSGADDLLVALSAGLQVQGTLSQLSVMTAASWKARFDV